jgi:hypothetical protein
MAALVRRDQTRPPWSQPPPWTKTALAEAAQLHEKHTVFRHLQVLALAGLLTEEPTGYRFDDHSPLINPLADLLAELERLPTLALPASRGAR